jgi:pimeloyl-ACP methyl ester carboxylesterase
MRSKKARRRRACNGAKKKVPTKSKVPLRLAFKGDLYFYSVDHDLHEQLAQIDGRRCPMVIMTGTYDYLTPPEATENTARQIKGGIYIEMTDAGHFPMSENYSLFRVYLKEGLRIIEERKGA